MREVANYLMVEYYEKMFPDKIPPFDQLVMALDLQKDKVVVVHEGANLVGVAIFLTLEDLTFENIESIDLCDVDVLSHLLKEKGRNVHFILLTAKCIQSILAMGRAVYDAKNPKTVSWWDPKRKILHRRHFN